MATSLSVGSLIRSVLLASEDVQAFAPNKIYPIISKEGATLPYITYQRGGFDETPQKYGGDGNDVVTITINCYAESYDDAVNIAEAVRGALDMVRDLSDDSLSIRRCNMTDSSETYEGGAFIQSLVFLIAVNKI